MTEVVKTKSGINIIFDELDNISTCSVGVFVKTGSKDEADNEAGISHVLEHMIFKGTPSRNYFQISEETDYLGSSINAHTTKEQTVFFINALSEYLNETLDILFDIVVNSTIDKDELEKEKDVIIEEIRMYKDSPDDLVSELNVSDAVSGQYGKPIIGTEESVRSFTPEMIKKYYKERYTKDNIAISVSGKFNKEQIIAKVEEYFGKLDEVKTDRINNFIKESGKILVLPKVIDKETMIAIEDKNQYIVSPFGNKEPDGKEYIGSIDVIITPGVAFDREKNRVGFGRGYYDRFFAIHKNAKKIAIAFEKQIIEEGIETTEYDMKVDVLITEDNIIK